MSLTEKILLYGLTMLALIAVLLILRSHAHPPSCPVDSDPRFAAGYWYCAPHGPTRWGPMS